MKKVKFYEIRIDRAPEGLEDYRVYIQDEGTAKKFVTDIKLDTPCGGFNFREMREVMVKNTRTDEKPLWEIGSWCDGVIRVFVTTYDDFKNWYYGETTRLA